MTKHRKDKTHLIDEFNFWLMNYRRDDPQEKDIRVPDRIDSSLGFRATDIDFVWYRKYFNKETGISSRKWMLFEVKTKDNVMEAEQHLMLEMIHQCCLSHPIHSKSYYGFQRITFERTSPEDGWIKVNDTIVTYDEFLTFLEFNGPEELYQKECLFY